MQKSKIEWCTHTWNPVTGCLHGCEYCYARKIAKRFCSNEFGTKDGLLSELHCSQGCLGCSEMDGLEFVGQKLRFAHGGPPFPFGFLPTFYQNRLDEPQHRKKPSNIFAVSMGDLFGKWVPDEWMQKVFDACERAPQHRYIFLTKNPVKLPRSTYIVNKDRFPDNYWFGISINTQADMSNRTLPLVNCWGNTFLSIEPLFEKINLTNIKIADRDVYADILGGYEYHLGGGGECPKVKWVIVGAETGNRKEKVVPKLEWIQDIVDQCRAANVPVFLKNSLQDIWGETLIQEFPW